MYLTQKYGIKVLTRENYSVKILRNCIDIIHEMLLTGRFICKLVLKQNKTRPLLKDFGT